MALAPYIATSIVTMCLSWALLGHGALAKAASESSRRKTLPPAWTTSKPPRPLKRATPRPWYKPHVALGAGLHLPEILPLEMVLLFGDYVGLKFFWAPPIPFHARVEMPSDVISSKKGLGVANPDFTINFDVRYGPQWGAEAWFFPFGGSFFAGGGLSIREMGLSGEAQSGILVCSLIEAAKEPPCGDPAARLETQTELRIHANVTSAATLGRLVVGGFWHVGETGYFTLTVGLTQPLSVRRTARVDAALATASTDNSDITGALAEVKREKEAELATKAQRELRPVDEKVLPLIGLSLGIRL